MEGAVTVEQILEQGRLTAELLSSETFQAAVDSTLREIQTEWSQSAPGEGQLRDLLHAEQRALLRLLCRLRVQINAAQAINMEAEQSEIALRDFID